MPEKRKFESSGTDAKSKKTAWQHDPANQLSPFSVGIFLTCVRGKEGVATKDALEMLNDYAERHNLISGESGTTIDEASSEAEVDIEASIASELGTINEAKKPSRDRPFSALKTLTECVIFIKTAKGIDPVEVVHGLCTEAKDNPRRKIGGRFIKRMTPISVSSDPSLNGLASCLEKLLPVTFQGKSLKYKIEPTFRNHNVLNRDLVIPEVASAISKTGEHKVDLKQYDVLVMIEVIRGFLGISVVRDWEKFRKYNLAEIYIDSLPPKEKSTASVQADAEK